ncbi:MAG: hypothetical protein KJO34_12410, partial [Deltaproteobacteria bacterium]|nr:hypothetical protein [Deltaproteobacteria bacterium]
ILKNPVIWKNKLYWLWDPGGGRSFYFAAGSRSHGVFLGNLPFPDKRLKKYYGFITKTKVVAESLWVLRCKP